MLLLKKIVLFTVVLNILFLPACSKNPEPEAKLPGEPSAGRDPEKLEDLDVVYADVLNEDGETGLKMDIYYPTGAAREKSPLLVGFHGGGWIAGDKSQIIFMFGPIIEKLRENGYTVATVQYRYASDEAPFPSQAEDCARAVSYLIDNAEKYFIDPDRIGVIGYSAGAQLAMLTSYAYGLDIKYCLSFAGPSKMYGEELGEYSMSMRSLFEYLFGGPYSEKESEYIQGSPYYYIDKTENKAPLLLAHDEYDDVVPFGQSRKMYEKTVEAGIFCELLVLGGFYHQINFNSNYYGQNPETEKFVDTILNFIYKYS